MDCANVGMDGSKDSRNPDYKFEQCIEWHDYLKWQGHPCVMVVDGSHLDRTQGKDGKSK